MLPATNTAQRIAHAERYPQAVTREAQILALLTERRGEKLTASDIASALKTGNVENIRSAIKRLHARGEIRMTQQVRQYAVGNSTCRHKAALWFMP